MLYFVKEKIRSAVPESWILLYHFILAFLGAVYYGFPAKKIKIVGVTGTKGKSSTAEFINAALEKAGFKSALSSTIRFKIGDKSMPNKFKMTMPGRFFLQKFIYSAVKEGCDWVVLEMTSEGAKMHRHKFIYLDALIFTNLAPEHLESHGSMEKYFAAKLSLGKYMEKSPKRPRWIIANADSEYAEEFLKLQVENAIPYSLEQAKPLEFSEDGVEFSFGESRIFIKHKSEFSVYNALAAAFFAKFVAGIDEKTIKIAFEELKLLPGRLEHIKEGQNFDIVVDYAHTPDSLKQLYESFAGKELVCVLGSTGGGRDKWKRPEMAKIASSYCKKVILTDEDPYDEDPMQIINDMKKGCGENCEVVLDRGEAIRRAVRIAFGAYADAVIISGKGTDPYIMRAGGQKEKWSDADVARKAIRDILKSENKSESDKI